MLSEDVTGTLSSFANNDSDSDSDINIDPSVLSPLDISTKTEEPLTEGTPVEEVEEVEDVEEVVEEVTKKDTSMEGESVTFNTLDSNIEQLKKIKNLPVKKFYSKSADNDDIGSGYNDWRKRLSNFYISLEKDPETNENVPKPITIDDMTWTTLEGWFQASKFMYNKKDTVYMSYISKFQHEGPYASDPKISKKQGGRKQSDINHVTLDPNWDILRNEVMFKGLVYKIAQQSDIQTILQKIKGSYLLLHHSTRDKYWGGSKKGSAELKGENILGLMYTFLANHIDEINVDTYKELFIKFNLMVKPYRIALTFGDAGENHVGMQMVGKLGSIGSGFTTEELHGAQEKLTEQNIISEYHSFNRDGEDAGILIIRNYISDKEHMGLLEDMNSFDWDSKFWDRRRKKVLNKKARTNVVILDGITQEPDYPNKKGRIVDTHTLQTFKNIKKNIVELINTSTNTDKGDNLICEGNRYYDLNICGIGYHGDKERRKVIAISIGASTNMNWQWFKQSKPVGEPYTFVIHAGDIYIMSEKAVGYDWRSPSKLTLRHAAGARKYTCLDKYSETTVSIEYESANKKIIKRNDHSGFSLEQYGELEKKTISLDSAYDSIEALFTIKQSYNNFIEKNINRISKQQNVAKFSFTLDNKTFINLSPEVYTTIKDNKVTYTCDIYNICNHSEKNNMVHQKIYSKQISIPKSAYYSTTKKKINTILQKKLLTIKLRSLLNKINLLNFLDIDTKELDDVKDSYKRLFNIIKSEYTTLDTLKETIYRQYRDTTTQDVHNKEYLDFIKTI